VGSDQSHLDFNNTVNYGSFYTPDEIIDQVYGLLEKNIADFGEYTMLDTSCGYGSFMRKAGSVGADVDETAVRIAKERYPDCRFIHHNSLNGTDRAQYQLIGEKIIIVGNPPYNDTTSLVRKGMKRDLFPVDPEIRKRDVGISFLLSYVGLSPDYVCVLHPLSYLLKKTNFKALDPFVRNYKLIDCLVVGSGRFSATSKITQFPIAVALYKREDSGMSHDYIMEYCFKTEEGKKFRLSQYEWLGDYVNKYPNQKRVPIEDTVALFWTMRDVNALKRSQTFMEKESYNSIRVTGDNFHYYCYADVFKEYIKHIPYYFGNCDIIFRQDKFIGIRDLFIAKSLEKHPFLRAGFNDAGKHPRDDDRIKSYFQELLGEHYAD
jgi:hypothetical protein